MPRTERRTGAPRRERRSPPAEPLAPRLSPERAFVVQLEIRRPANRRTLRGRVEHLVTGEARHFGSAEELVGFMSRFRGLLLVAMLVVPTVAVAAPPPVCPDGRFLLVDQEPLAGGVPAPAIDAVILADATLAVASGCPPVPAKVKGTRRGTRISASWPKGACAGFAQKVRLKGTIDSECNTLRGKLTAKKRRQRFEAQRSACNDGVLDRDGGEVCPTLEGKPDGLALDAMVDLDAPTLIPASAYDTDARGALLVRTRIRLGFADEATLGAVNALIASVGGRIVSMLENVPGVVLDIPDPGSIPALDALVAGLEADPAVTEVLKSYEPVPTVLPDNYTAPLADPAAAQLDHHLAVRAAAAWNARAAMSDAPTVAVLDYFGDGAPGNAFDVIVPADDFSTSGIGADGEHGYHVLGIIAASFGGVGTDPGRATGMVPDTVTARVADLQDPDTDFFQDQNRVLQRLKDGAPHGILNTSLGGFCGQSLLDLEREGTVWAKMVRLYGLEGRVLHVAAAGNILAECPTDTDADSEGRFQAAALLPLQVPNLTNMLVVENVVNGGAPGFEPSCLADSSKFPGHLAGIGTDVFSLTRASGAAGDKTGTSMASPQVAGLAAYLWALGPGMDVQQLRQVLLATAQPVPGGGGQAGCSAVAPAPIIDAYAAVLALDAAALPDPISAPVRRAILDADASGRFDDADLVAFVDALIDPLTGDPREPAAPDFGRHDLNGDGFTGGPQRTARFDLDRIDSEQFGESGHGVVLQTIGGVDVPFDETRATDLDILCYYTYSDLFEGTDPVRNTAVPFERCARAGTEVVFPAQVSPGTPTLLAVRVVAIGANGATLGPLAGVQVELAPSGGSVAALSGITDAQGFFETQATAAPGATTFTIDIVVRRAPGAPELVQDFAQAAVVGTPSVTVTTREATIHAEAFAIGASPPFVEDDRVAPPDFTTFTDTSTAQRSAAGTNAEATVSQSTTLAVDGAGALSGITSDSAASATGAGVNADARGESDLGIDFEVTSGAVAFVLSGSLDAPFAGPDQEGDAGVLFVLQGPGVQLQEVVGTFVAGGPPVGPPSTTLSSSGILGPGQYGLSVSISTQAQAHDRSESQTASWNFTLTLSPVIGTTSTSTSSTTTSTSTLPSSSTTITSTTSTTTTTLFGLPVIPYTRYAATGPDGPVVTLADEFVTETVDLGAVMLELPPVTIDGELPFDPVSHQTCYAHPGGTLDDCIDVQDRFGAAALRIGDPVGVCTRERLTSIAVDNFKCYQANGSALEVDVLLEDAFQSQAVTVGAPELLCTPVEVDGEPLVEPLRYLVCYATTPLGATGGPIEVDDILHPNPIQVDVGVATGLCVPAVRQQPATCVLCGNGTVDGDEDCDDGGVFDGDGCSAVCRFELDCTCDGVPLPPPDEERCATLADCGGFCTGCTAGGGVCGCQ